METESPTQGTDDASLAVESTAGGAGGAPQQGSEPRRGDGGLSKLYGVIEFVISFALMLGVVAVLRTFLIEPFTIPSGSMIPTIQKGDSLYVEKVSTSGDDFVPEVGQVYTFTSPTDPTETLIKRVIAVQGQTIDLRDGDVYIDGVKLDEPYVHGQLTEAMNNTKGITYPYTIPDGCFWAMGDNRGNSSDSRVFGPVQISSITGHAFYRYWPIFRSTETVTVDFGAFEFTFDPLDLNIGSLDYT
jgi:signal peptidase I